MHLPKQNSNLKNVSITTYCLDELINVRLSNYLDYYREKISIVDLNNENS